MLDAIGLSSIVTISTIALGAGTNKILAVLAGQEGVALLGLYRTLTAILIQVVAMGAGMVIVRNLSSARSQDETLSAIRTIFTFGAIQTLVLLTLAIVAGPIVSWLVFGVDYAAHVSETRLAIGMAVGVLAMQLSLAVLNGQRRLREALKVNFTTSACTLAVAYPLVSAGPIGIVLLLGATCFLGAGLAIFYILRSNPISPSLIFRMPSAAFFQALPVSGALTLQPFIVLGTALVIQSQIARHYGLDQLGLFAAAVTLETTSLAVLTAAMTSYFLPSLGTAPDEAEREALFNETLGILVPLSALGVTFIASIAPQLIGLLFSTRFLSASTLAGTLGIAIIAQAYTWSYGLMLVHRGRLRTHVALATLESGVRLSASVVCIAMELPLLSLAYVHIASCALAAVAYATGDRWTRGRFVLSPRNRRLALAAACSAPLIVGIAHIEGSSLRLFPAGVMGAAWLVVFLLQNSRRASQEARPEPPT